MSSIHLAVRLCLSGKYLNAIKTFEKLQFSPFDILEWVRDNNILLLRSVWDECEPETDRPDGNSAEILNNFEKLLTKIRSISCAGGGNMNEYQSLILECVVLYNFLFLHTMQQLTSTKDPSTIQLHIHTTQLEITLGRILRFHDKYSPSKFAHTDISNPVKRSKLSVHFPWFYSQPVVLLCHCLAHSSKDQTLSRLCRKFLTEAPPNEIQWKICFVSPVLVSFEEKLRNCHRVIQQLSVVLNSFDPSFPVIEDRPPKPDVWDNTNPYKSYSVYMKAYSLYVRDEFEAALNLLEEEKSSYDATPRWAMFLNLEACCHFKTANYWTAVEKFQAALKVDFSFLVPLLNIAVVYHHQPHRPTNRVRAELDTLTTLIAALTTPPSSPPDPVHLLQHKKLQLCRHSDLHASPVFLPYSMYLISRRCLQESLFEEATDHYLDLLHYFRTNTFLRPPSTCVPPCSLPSVSDIYLEAAFCMLQAAKYQECIIISDWLLNCLNGDSDQLHNRTMHRISKRCDDDDDDDDDDGNDCYFLESPPMSKRCDYTTECADNSPQHGLNCDHTGLLSQVGTNLLALLYKADSLVHIGQLSDALQLLQQATTIVRENPHLLIKASPKPQASDKNQREEPRHSTNPLSAKATTHTTTKTSTSTTTTATTSTSTTTTTTTSTVSISEQISSLISAVYNNSAVILHSRGQYKEAIHCFRLGLQLSPTDLLLCFNCVLCLLQVQQCHSAAQLWMSCRQTNINSSKTALKKYLQSIKTQLETLKNESDKTHKPHNKSWRSYSERPSVTALLKLDMAILEYVLMTRTVK